MGQIIQFYITGNKISACLFIHHQYDVGSSRQTKSVKIANSFLIFILHSRNVFQNILTFVPLQKPVKCMLNFSKQVFWHIQSQMFALFQTYFSDNVLI